MKKQNAQAIKTVDQYVELVKKMKETGNYNLDLSQYTPNEVHFIAGLIESEETFQFFECAKGIDIRKIIAVLEYCEAKGKLEKML